MTDNYYTDTQFLDDLWDDYEDTLGDEDFETEGEDDWNAMAEDAAMEGSLFGWEE